MYHTTRIPPSQSSSKKAVEDAETAGLPPMPDAAELDRVFVLLLNELGIPPERQQLMMLLPAAKKWLLITQHKDRAALVCFDLLFMQSLIICNRNQSLAQRLLKKTLLLLITISICSNQE